MKKTVNEKLVDWIRKKAETEYVWIICKWNSESKIRC